MKMVYFMVLWFSTSALANVSEAIRDLAKADLWQAVKVSPTGKYLSAVSKVEGKNVIVLFDMSTMKPLHKVQFKGYAQPGEYDWIGDRRIVLERTELVDWSDHPRSYGHYYALNVDGRLGNSVFTQDSSYGFDSVVRSGYLLEPLANDPRSLLMVGEPFKDKLKPVLFKVNSMTGYLTRVANAPVYSPRFVLDAQQQLRFVFGVDEQSHSAAYQFKGQKWVQFEQFTLANNSFTPISIKEGSRQVYGLYAPDNKTHGLYLFDLDSGKRRLLFAHEKVDISHYSVAKDGHVYAIELDDGYPATLFIEPQHPQAKILKQLMSTLEGYNVRVVSETLDGKLKVVYAYNQFSPGEYLLYNSSNKQLTYLFGARPWVDSTTVANVVPYQFTARDGTEISAYVTLPKGVETLKALKQTPFVVKVHGGPFGVRDYLEYDPENQLFANQGIGVLQVNFRGSGGYGRAFKNKGFLHWGDDIQFDIIDGIKALSHQGIADPDRLCIVGSGFGGYSALQSSIIAPELFKCAVSQMGVYDLSLLQRKGEGAIKQVQRNYLAQTVGEDPALLIAQSPIHHLSKLKTPLLVIHGQRDKRVPIEHAYKLIKRLKRLDKSYQWMALETNGHGYYRPELRERVYQRVLTFVQSHFQL